MPGKERDAIRIGVIGFLAGVVFQPGMRNTFSFKRPLQGVGLPGVAVDHRDVVERLAVLLPFADAAGDVVGFVVEGVEFAERRWRAASAGHFRGDQGDVVVVGALGLQEVLGKVVGVAEDFAGVAVIQFQDGGAATGLDAGAGQGELEAALLVDGLGIVVEQQQRVGVRVDHLHDKGQPVLLEVVAFVDHHRAVLGAGDLALVHGLHDRLHLPLPGFQLGRSGDQVHVIGLQLPATPFMEVVHLHFFFDAFFGNKAA